MKQVVQIFFCALGASPIFVSVLVWAAAAGVFTVFAVWLVALALRAVGVLN